MVTIFLKQESIREEPMATIQIETLVIGAGMSGLTCARRLAEFGHQVLVVDKARGSGGRIASKTLTLSDGQQVVFDLGCAGIAAQTPTFLQQIQVWQEAGLIERWRTVGGIVEYVGKPRNSILTRSMADRLDTRFGLCIEQLEFRAGKWWVHGVEQGVLQAPIEARHIVLATPAEQAVALLPATHTLREVVAQVTTLPQWVVVIVSDHFEYDPPHPDLLSLSPIIGSIVCDSRKPGRSVVPGRQVWQIQLHPEWSGQHCHFNTDRDATITEVYRAVLDELERITGQSVEVSDHYVQRWLYASGHTRLVQDAECLWDTECRIGICGDYFYHPELTSNGIRQFGVESAFLSGRALAARMQD
jgi:predicted NAD/FAD-dependent oxidoreductase